MCEGTSYENTEEYDWVAKFLEQRGVGMDKLVRYIDKDRKRKTDATPMFIDTKRYCSIYGIDKEVVDTVLKDEDSLRIRDVVSYVFSDTYTRMKENLEIKLYDLRLKHENLRILEEVRHERMRSKNTYIREVDETYSPLRVERNDMEEDREAEYERVVRNNERTILALRKDLRAADRRTKLASRENKKELLDAKDCVRSMGSKVQKLEHDLRYARKIISSNENDARHSEMHKADIAQQYAAKTRSKELALLDLESTIRKRRHELHNSPTGIYTLASREEFTKDTMPYRYRGVPVSVEEGELYYVDATDGANQDSMYRDTGIVGDLTSILGV